ncbi:MAG TPA: hypothetical protein VGB85_22535 [Nannocystis sp.]
MRPSTLVFLVAVAAAGCGDAPALASLTSAATETPHGSTSTGTDEPGSTSETGTPGSDETGTSTTPSGASTTSDADSSTGQPALPKLLEATLTPEVITVEGSITAHALAQDADGVRMQVDGGAPVELDELAPGEFTGQLGVFTALSNGTHDVVFTAWDDSTASEPLSRQYEAKLNPAGGESYWDASGVLGQGFGRGVAIDPATGAVYEFFDVKEGDGERCHVRRRGAQGEYFEADLIAVLPEQQCTGTAISVAADGTLYVLAEGQLNGDATWWLGRKDSWDAPMLTLAWGDPGEKAYAIAVHAERAEVAVCGTTLTDGTDFDELDGRVAIFRKDMPGYEPAPFDYTANQIGMSHFFDETLRDCAYDGDTLVLAGEANGKHPDNLFVDYSRLLLIEYDTVTDAAHWTVAEPGPGLAVQSGARSLAITDGDTYLTFGYACAKQCTPQLHLREFLPGGIPSGWNVLPAVNATFATDVAWSPAGYAVIAAGKVQGQWSTEFWLQGWVPGEEIPAWEYGHLDQPGLQIALAVAVAKFGRIYAVGVAGQGDLGVPALAIIDP